MSFVKCASARFFFSKLIDSSSAADGLGFIRIFVQYNTAPQKTYVRKLILAEFYVNINK
jgi:hypothetical protein